MAAFDPNETFNVLVNVRPLLATALRAIASLGRVYLARFQTRSTRPPPAEATGLVYFSSPPETVKARFWVVPSQLGKVLVSTWKVKDLSFWSTVYLPKWAMLPATTA